MTSPEPERIDWLSHTQCERLRMCLLREAFSRDAAFASMKRPSPPALLGRVCHRISEEVSRGELVRADADRRWEELIGEAHAQLIAASVFGAPPPPETWPGYHLARARTLIALRRDTPASSAPVVEPAPFQSASELRQPQQVDTELEIRDEERRLYGWIDRVEQGTPGPRIVDLKTGWRQSLEVTPPQRRQLLLYAYLWKTRSGEWPANAAIQLADGRTVDMGVDPAAAMQVVDEALKLRSRFNQTVGSDWREAATPSPDACVFCDFQACCPSFMTEADQSWGLPRAWVRGTIAALGEGSLKRVEIDPDDGVHTDHATVLVVGIPPGLELGIGERVGLADLNPTSTDNTYAADWRTKLHRWE